MYKLLISDLDGTMLDDHHAVPQTNIEYINKALEAGVEFAFCSGRSYTSLANFEKILGINKKGVFGICFNGSIVYDSFTHAFLRDERMEISLALEIIEKLKEFNASIVVYDGGSLVVESFVPLLVEYADKSGIAPTIVESFDKMKNNINKVLIKGPYELLCEVEKNIAPLFQGRVNHFFSNHDLFEFSPLKADKGQGCKFLANHLNIPIEEVIAVGDHLNDIDMIKTVGLGIVVNNGQDALKQYADYITETTNNDGVFKEIVEKFVLK